MRISVRLYQAIKAKELGLTVAKRDDFSQWYTQSLIRSEMLDYSDVSGCYILRPWGYAIWAHIQAFMNTEFKSRGIQDSYFPLLIPEPAIQREQAHLEGFSPEVAWVTHAGDAPLNVRLAVRPTSETAIYPAYSRWIKTWRDLPLRLNQWCNVVRWEFKNPQPLIRSREFLWQEGHSAFASREEADAEVRDILGLYRRVFEEMLAVPVMEGVKSETEKFAGAEYTTTVEAFIPEAGRAIQGATSHGLGQNFSRMFDIKFEDGKGQLQYAWQNSWGFTTRSIGVMAMVHGDDQGMVLPPRVATTQVVVLPVGITTRTDSAISNRIRQECQTIAAQLNAGGIRTMADLAENQTPGWKFSHWELKGVPLRIEVGPKELDSEAYSYAVRYDGTKGRMLKSDLVNIVTLQLESIHNGMLSKARKKYLESIIPATNWDTVTQALAAGKMCMIPWCEEASCERSIKERTSEQAIAGAKCLCIPFEQPFEILSNLSCPACSRPSKRWTLFARSY
ncbi:hypothetical protein PSACC_03057 [Paramicrosporidium saccamoebae]|uniref:Proline--tRNA ligase n=1 Tax=Paramicrosporidium saccamoebae TaxID=1246581 RepID=A0A2H9THB3_9FUNG|nr:hypothetical protein PSACC_03057 [Paramicrosporidium saccamoebae]